MLEGKQVTSLVEVMEEEASEGSKTSNTADTNKQTWWTCCSSTKNGCLNSESIVKHNHAALCLSLAVSMLMIKFSEDGHTFWLKFRCKSACIDDVAFFVVEVKVNESEFVRQFFMAFAFKKTVLACAKLLTWKGGNNFLIVVFEMH